MAPKGFIDKHQQLSFLTFQIGNEMFATDIKNVIEVLTKEPLVKLPNSPEYIEGLLQFRDKSLPVVNSYIKFGLQPPAADGQYVMISFEATHDNHQIYFAAMADKVNGVVSIKQGDIEPMPETGAQSYNFISGLFKINGTVVLIVDIVTVFMSNELISISELKNNEQ